MKVQRQLGDDNTKCECKTLNWDDSYKRFDIFVARGGSSIRVWMNLKIVWVGSMGDVTGWESMQHQRGLYFSIGRKSASFNLHKWRSSHRREGRYGGLPKGRYEAGIFSHN